MSAARDRRNNIKRGWQDDIPPVPVGKIDAALYGALRDAEGDQLILQDGKIQVGSFRLTSNGLEIISETDQDEWGKLGELLFRLEGSMQWLIGDWLVYGETLSYGDLKTRVEEMGRDYNTIRNYMVVCRAFELSRRRYNLSFGHYQAAASLESEEQQDEALAYAQQEKMSVAAFRKAIHGEQPALPAERKYNIAQMTDSVYEVAQKDLMSIPVREIRSALDSLKLIQLKNAEAEARLQAALEQRSKK
jgi:hypothetical protein